MKARTTTTDQGRAPGLYDEQQQRLQQEKRLAKGEDAPEPRVARAFFANMSAREDRQPQ